MKKLASSNAVEKAREEDVSSSLSTTKGSKPEQIQQKMERYLLDRYRFRFNVLAEQTEYSKKDGGTPVYKVISQRTLNSLCLEVRACHINCPDKDVSRFVNSDRMAEYHHSFSVWLPLLFYDCSDKDSCSCMV